MKKKAYIKPESELIPSCQQPGLPAASGGDNEGHIHDDDSKEDDGDPTNPSNPFNPGNWKGKGTDWDDDWGGGFPYNSWQRVSGRKGLLDDE